MRICNRCVLPETYPGVVFDTQGTCSVCNSYHDESDHDARQITLRQEFDGLVQALRGRGAYDCLLAYSGGKDSTYTLWLLAVHYQLRVLAITFDNGFNSPQSISNIRRVLASIDADSLIVRPRHDVLRAIFSGVASNNPYPLKALERASGICNACIGMVKNICLRIALEHQIPLVAYGWSPGQAPMRGALFQMNARMLRQTYDVRNAILVQLAGRAIEPYLVTPSLLEQCETFPYSVHPLAFHDYDEHAIISKIRGFGWEAPADTDGNSSNCRLNSLANRLHITEYGFHPYAFEIANLVRSGCLSRDEGLAHLDDLGSDDVARSAARELGLSISIVT